MTSNATSRFSKTVEHYIKYRPNYPSTIIDFFQKKLKGSNSAVIADIGSGTGLSSKLFLDNGNKVYGIEPNSSMREAAENQLKNYPNFYSINGIAEDTSLQNQSMDFVIAGQAFHWFDIGKSRREFQRILKPNGKVLIFWNVRDDTHSKFMEGYHQFLLNYSIDYQLIMKRRGNKNSLENFFGHKNYGKATFENFQVFDLEGLKGRYFSCSYALTSEHEKYEKALQKLERLFETYQENGAIKMWYKTEMYFGEIR